MPLIPISETDREISRKAISAGIKTKGTGGASAPRSCGQVDRQMDATLPTESDPIGCNRTENVDFEAMQDLSVRSDGTDLQLVILHAEIIPIINSSNLNGRHFESLSRILLITEYISEADL